MDLRGLSRNGRAVHWALEAAPMRDGWACADRGGWLWEDPPGLPHRTVAALKTTLRSLERRGAADLRTGNDGRLYARHVSRRGPTETRALAEATRVIFRRWYKRQDGTGVIALFPDLAYDRAGAMCMSFEHVGQHGGADLAGVISRTRPATPEEYAPLARELERYPYDYVLAVCRRTPSGATANRLASANGG